VAGSDWVLDHGSVPPGTVEFKTYSVQLVDLVPRPRIGGKLKPSDYRLLLAIDVIN
jgi:hypothetical protein